jgi:hypothetical protein
LGTEDEFTSRIGRRFREKSCERKSRGSQDAVGFSKAPKNQREMACQSWKQAQHNGKMNSTRKQFFADGKASKAVPYRFYGNKGGLHILRFP